MKTLFFDDFKTYAEKQYPYNWVVEQNCENPNRLGWVDNAGFYLLYAGNKHIPLAPPLKDFCLDMVCRGDLFFSDLELLIFFRYDRRMQAGYCLKYHWGISGGKTHARQQELSSYKVSFCRYYGRRQEHKFEVIGEKEIPGFCNDLSADQRLRLEVKDTVATFHHNDRLVGIFPDPVNTFPDHGHVAFDRSGHGKPAFCISRVNIRSDETVSETTVVPKRSVEFPSSVNGLVSPYIFHVSILESAGRKIMRTQLTGGPSKEPIHPDFDRCRFNEKMVNPYVRLESSDGKPFGKFYIFSGSVGLSAYHWNTAASIMLPADSECPLEKDFIFDDLPENPRCFIGYEYYQADDSISQAGGPTEAFIDETGTIRYAGAPLIPGSVQLDIESPPDKKLCSKIPRDIPFYEDALLFAQANHYFYESEPVRLAATVRLRDKTVEAREFIVKVTLENAFKEPMAKPREYNLLPAGDELSCRLDVQVLKTDYFKMPPLPVGVYHIRTELCQGRRKAQELRRAFEVMADDPMSVSAPVASGLPKLFINILSGIKSEHFFPWGHATVDIAHYNLGGDNFFKVARDWRCWDLFHLYGRKWLCWIGLWKTPGAVNETDANTDLIKVCDAGRTEKWRIGHDLWIRSNYATPLIHDLLLQFMRSRAFKPVQNGCLTLETVAKNEPRGISLEQFRELVAHQWKAWIMYFSEVITGQVIPAISAKIRAINPACLPFEFCPVYPTYGSVYKAGYFPFYFGKNLRAGLEQYLPGPNGFEDYPYSSGYAIARGIYQLASCKLEAPALTMYPELFGINGETNDSHVVYANPPYGRSDPPAGFFLKQFYEYSYGVAWFDARGFHFWNDHGYYPKTLDRENYDEMLYAYAFISRTKPIKPLRTTAFVFSLAACMAHPDYYEYDEDLFGQGYVFNTAEESVAFAYEQARADGQLAGFVVKMEDIANLDPHDIDMLTLPPLCELSRQERAAIRNLHEHGVSLMGFEDASGLEDLFGVAGMGPESPITDIAVCPGTVLAELNGMTEHTRHPLCKSRYQADGAETLLTGTDGLPVLVTNQTRWGKTAFYTIPPTVVRRAQAKIATYGQESISNLINRATALVMRYIGHPAVQTTAGKTLAFRDDRGTAHIIVEEDAWPRPGGPISPLVTIELPKVKAKAITSDKEFSVVEMAADRIKLRLHLAEHESARIRIEMGA